MRGLYVYVSHKPSRLN